MTEDFEKIFARLESPELPENLLSKIMLRINREQHVSLVRRRVAGSLMAFCSVAAMFVTFGMVRAGLAESGFTDYLALIFSDAGFVAAYWKNFIYLLLESLPAVSLAAFLAAIFTFLSSSRLLLRGVRFNLVFRSTKLV